MKTLVVLFLLAFAAGAYAECTCNTMKWATCDDPPCKCTIPLGDPSPQVLDCSKLIPKCFLMKAEMFRAKNGLSTRTLAGKPVESAFVDNDGIYDPDCEADGKFKAKQCNNTDVCWCVNSAGVRRTDKGDKSLVCDELVETYCVYLQLTHKPVSKAMDAESLKTGIENAILQRYGVAKSLVKDVKYDKDARLIVVTVNKTIGERGTDLSKMAYYMEKDIKVLPLFKDEKPFEIGVAGQKVEMSNILVYYLDEKDATMTMKTLTGGVIAVIVVVSLAVVGGLLILYFIRRREQANYRKTQAREMEPMS